MVEIIKFLKGRISGLNDLRKVSEQKNVEQTVFFTLGATEAFREILDKINQYEQDEIDSLDKIIKEIKTLEWYFNRIKKNQAFASDWEFKQYVKHYCDKITFLSEKLLRQIQENETNKV